MTNRGRSGLPDGRVPSGSVQGIVERVGHQAPQWFPDLAPKVTLVCHFVRGDTVGIRVHVGEAPRVRSVLARIPAGSGEVDRPRIVPRMDPGAALASEYRALQALAGVVDTLRDRRFGAIRPLELYEPGPALIIEERLDPRLTRRIWGAHRLVRLFGISRLRSLLANAGELLRSLHQVSDPASVERSSTVHDYVATVDASCRYLAADRGDRAFFRLSDQLAAWASEVFPAELPTGLSHGSFSADSVLVGSSGEVVLSGARTIWRAPIYEDLVGLLVGIRTMRLQSATRGLALSVRTRKSLERAFLEGYGGDLDPLMLRLFSVQALLDAWVSTLAAGRTGRSTQRWYRRQYRSLVGS